MIVQRHCLSSQVALFQSVPLFNPTNSLLYKERTLLNSMQSVVPASNKCVSNS